MKAPSSDGTRNASRPEAAALEGTAAVEAIARLVRQFKLEDAPLPVVDKARQLLLIGFSWSLLGERSREARVMAGVLAGLGMSGRCTVFGARRQVGCADAAYLNAAHAQVHDCNDGCPGRGAYHAGRVLVPVACAVAEHVQASGKQLLEALIVGYEVAHRAHLDRPRRRSEGVGAASVAGRLLGLSNGQLVHAIWLTEQHMPHVQPGPDNFNADANHICNGLIARAAVESALFARAGLTAQAGPSQLMLDDDLPVAGELETFLTRRVYIKPFVACRHCHNAIEIARAFRESHGELVGQIERVDVVLRVLPDYVTQRVAADAYFKTAHFSVPYSVAAALLHGDADAEVTSSLAADAIHALQRKVFVSLAEEDGPAMPPHSLPAEVRIVLQDGRSFSDARVFPHGSLERPMSEVQLIALFHKWAGPSLGDRRRARIVDKALNAGQLEDVRDLTSLLRPA